MTGVRELRRAMGNTRGNGTREGNVIGVTLPGMNGILGPYK